jgi:catechol 2,3-dioxygenase-like lactoylglutathione lyase family enzyme
VTTSVMRKGNAIMRLWVGLALVSFGTGAIAADTAEPAGSRPAVTGISHIAVYARDMAASDHFYGHILGGLKAPNPEDPAGARYFFGPQQFVEVLPTPAGQGPSMLSHVAYITADAAALHRYAADQGFKPGKLQSGEDGSRWFSATDPEGNEVRFVQSGRAASLSPSAVSGRIIHVGYLVRSRSAEDRFYKELLGFRPYWFGAMREGAVDWVSQQVPDGRDWLEYMMVGDGSTTPADRVDARQLGILNHVSLAVPNMQAAMTRLHAEKRLPERYDGPSMGLDGKWQANLYDPDGTRVELMEYKAVMKPCCSPFTAEDPVP